MQTELLGVIYWVTSSCRVECPPLYLSKALDITELGQAGGGRGKGWGKWRARSRNAAAPGYRSEERFCHKSPGNMSGAVCLLFYTEGTAVVQKYWFFPLYGDRDCQTYGLTLVWRRQLFPTLLTRWTPQEKPGKRCQCPLLRHREKQMPAETASVSPAPTSCAQPPAAPHPRPPPPPAPWCLW